jgi:hypothetical protein
MFVVLGECIVFITTVVSVSAPNRLVIVSANTSPGFSSIVGPGYPHSPEGSTQNRRVLNDTYAELGSVHRTACTVMFALHTDSVDDNTVGNVSVAAAES